ncbi:MAG: TPM domain-containing protein [Thauera sp.]|nr:TPM domain-containing protein [Thauera sp.]
MEILRLLRHLWLDTGDARRALGDDGLARIEARIRSSETTHSGEICVCVEAALPGHLLWRHLRSGESFARLSRERAIELFSAQRVWDTEANNGVLIYLQLAEHRVEIVADRGVNRHVTQAHWDALLADVSQALRARSLADGIGQAIDGVGDALQRHFPWRGTSEVRNEDELPDRPTLL